MSKDLFEPMSVEEFLGLTLPEEFGKKRRYVPVCLGGMGESGMNFFAPDKTHRDVSILQSAEKIKISYKTGGKTLELEADFTAPPQLAENLPTVKISRLRISSFESPESYRVTCFSRSPEAAAEKPSILGGLFAKISKRQSNITKQTKELTHKRINVALHVISHAYSSIVQGLVPEVGPDHPVFSDEIEPKDPPLKLRNINAGALAGLKHARPRP